MLSLAEIQQRLEDRPPVLADPEGFAPAAVALVVCDAAAGAEVLFIERSLHDRDPWSGHLGFPGGRVDPVDPDRRAAAERETREEVGLDPARGEYLGRLDDLVGTHFSIVISCFVFGMRRRPHLVLDPAEVADAFWFPLEGLVDPRRRREKTFTFRGERLTYPAIQLLEGDRPWLWGITYRLVASFFETLGRPL